MFLISASEWPSRDACSKPPVIVLYGISGASALGPDQRRQLRGRAGLVDELDPVPVDVHGDDVRRGHGLEPDASLVLVADDGIPERLEVVEPGQLVHLARG